LLDDQVPTGVDDVACLARPRWLEMSPPRCRRCLWASASVSSRYVQIDSSGEKELAFAQLLEGNFFGGVVLVADLADDLLDQILQRHQPGRPAVFIDDDGHVDPARLQVGQQIIGFFRLRHEQRRPQ
jgi:hypothetical protein